MAYSTLTNSLSDAVQRYRQEMHLSAEECACNLGVSKTALLNIEQKKANPTLETVEIIAANMGIDPLVLLGQKEPTNMVPSLLLMAMQTKSLSNTTLYTLPLAMQHMQTALNLMFSLSMEFGIDHSPLNNNFLLER